MAEDVDDGWPIILKIQSPYDGSKCWIEKFTTVKIAKQIVAYWKKCNYWVFIVKGQELLSREGVVPS